MEHASEAPLHFRRIKEIFNHITEPSEGKYVELDDLQPELRPEEASLQFEKNLKALLPQLARKAQEASDKLKPWMNKQFFALPLDYEHFKLVTALISRPELKGKVQGLSSLPLFLTSFVNFSLKLANLHEAIMSDNFLEELVWTSMESLRHEQERFREQAVKLGVQIADLVAKVTIVFNEKKRDKSATTAFVAGGAVGALGITTMIFGIVLAPFTAGVSIPLAAAAGAIAVGAAATAGGAAAVGVGIHKHHHKTIETISLQEALDNLKEFEALAQQMIDAFNEINEEFGPELIQKILDQSGLNCPICLEIASDDCKTVYYDDEEDEDALNNTAMEIYCTECIANWMALHNNPVSPKTRKPLREDMLVQERSTVKRIRAFRAQMTHANGVVARFMEAVQKRASFFPDPLDE